MVLYRPTIEGGPSRHRRRPPSSETAAPKLRHPYLTTKGRNKVHYLHFLEDLLHKGRSKSEIP